MFNRQYRSLTFLGLFSILVAVFFQPNIGLLYEQFIDIILHHGLLISDLMAIGLGGSFLNAGIILLMMLGILRFLKVELKGVHLAGLLTVYGFAFFGKTVIAIWPPFIGVLLYCYSEKQDIRTGLPNAMFATASAPAVATVYQVISGLSNPFLGYLSAIAIGLLIGFLLQMTTGYIRNLHESLILYNAGFGLGFILLLFFSLFKSFGLQIEVYNGALLTGLNHELTIIIIIIFAVFIIDGYIQSHYGKHEAILSDEVTDYVVHYCYGRALLNIGFLGLTSLAFIHLFKGDINGPIMAAIFTVAGFGAFGKTIKNVFPPMLGVCVMALITDGPATLSGMSFLITFLFASALAPVSARYGMIYGFIFGMTHEVIVTNTAVLHGYMSLYNNAFSLGLVVLILNPIAKYVMEKTKIDD